MKKHVLIALAYSTLCLGATAQEYSADTGLPADSRLEQLRLETKNSYEQLKPYIVDDKIVSADQEKLKLRTLAKDEEVVKAVDKFNGAFHDFREELKKHLGLTEEQVTVLVARSGFWKIPTTQPPIQRGLPKSKRWMVLANAKAYEGENNPNTSTQQRLLPLSIYYSSVENLPSETERAAGARVALYETPWLNEKGASPLGWVPAKDLYEWKHNVVLQLRNPEDRRISVRNSSYIPNPLFYHDSGMGREESGAIGPFNLFQDDGSKKQTAAEYFHQYQMGTGAAQQDALYDRNQAAAYEANYGVGLALSADSYSSNFILPIIGSGNQESSVYIGADGQPDVPHEVMLLSLGKIKTPGVAGRPDAVKVSRTEICIVMDLSDSMSPFVDGLKKAIEEQMQRIPAEHHDKIKLGIIGYRDNPTRMGRGKHVIEGFKFHGREDGKPEATTSFYNYNHSFKRDGNTVMEMLPAPDFARLLEKVKTPQGELDAVNKGNSRSEKDKLQADDMPEQLYRALEEAVDNPFWSKDEGVRKLVLIVGDAPDKSAATQKKADKGIAQARTIMVRAEANGIMFAPVFIDNSSYKKKENQEYREIGRQQFKELGNNWTGSVDLIDAGDVVVKDKEGNVLQTYDHGDLFRGILGEIIDKTLAENSVTIGTPSIDPRTLPDNIAEMMSHAGYLFSKAGYKASDNKILEKQKLADATASPAEKEADVSGMQRFWVTEYDPLAIAAGADEENCRTYDSYALMTREQLKNWLNLAWSFHSTLNTYGTHEPGKTISALALLFNASAYGYDEMASAYSEAPTDEQKRQWDELQTHISETLPCQSKFMQEFFKYMKGKSEDTFDFKSKLDKFLSGIMALSRMLDSGDIMQEKDAVNFNKQEVDGKSDKPKESQKLYKIPLEFLP